MSIEKEIKREQDQCFEATGRNYEILDEELE